ncbi:hypothetical protein [Peribacillus simplex]|uniref:hypothetical protein n=1 Tax=Peribacillus simplex TaxID=1478 RepID=UPI00333AB9B3
MYLKSLVSCINEWDSKVTFEKKTSLVNLLAYPLYRIGGKDNRHGDYDIRPLYYLESRIRELTIKERITEEFLVIGVLAELTKYFSDQVTKREYHIDANKRMLTDIEKYGDGAPVSLISNLQEKDSYLRSEDYLNLVNKELQVWEEVKTKYFSIDRMKEMDRELELAAYEEYKQNMTDNERAEHEEILTRMRDKGEINIEERLKKEQHKIKSELFDPNIPFSDQREKIYGDMKYPPPNYGDGE